MSSFFTNILSGFAVGLYGLKGGYTSVNVKGQSIRLAVDNFRTLQRAKTYSIKEPDTLDWLDSFEPGACFFDLGANIGQYSLYPAKKYGNGIRIYSFEPQCINYYLLNRNIHLNKLEETITSYCVAVSGEAGFSRLYIPRFIGGGNRSQFGKEDLELMKRPASHVQGMFGKLHQQFLRSGLMADELNRQIHVERGLEDAKGNELGNTVRDAYLETSGATARFAA